MNLKNLITFIKRKDHQIDKKPKISISEKWKNRKIKTTQFIKQFKSGEIDAKRLKGMIRKRLFGMQLTDGLIVKVITYLLLISLGFVFLYPIIFMVVSSFMSLDDLLDKTVKWVPRDLFYFKNITDAIKVLGMPQTLFTTILVALLPAVSTTIATSLIGYGFSRFNFPLKKLFFILMLATFLIPPQIILLPQYLWYKDIGLLGTPITYILPALFGQGLNAAIFILIFFSFFNMIPKSYEEAAKLDGASNMGIFFRISVPISIPAFVIVFLFSFVWYWNDSYLATLYFGNSKFWTTLPMELTRFENSYSDLINQGTIQTAMNESIKMAGTLIATIPLLVLYLILQKQFVESFDKAGITGE